MLCICYPKTCTILTPFWWLKIGTVQVCKVNVMTKKHFKPDDPHEMTQLPHVHFCVIVVPAEFMG